MQLEYRIRQTTQDFSYKIDMNSDGEKFYGTHHLNHDATWHCRT